MEKIKNYVSIIAVCVSVVLMLGALAISINTNNTLMDAQTAIAQMSINDNVDTQVIEVDWGLGYDGDTVRMVCGWAYEENSVEDQMGNVWDVDCDLSEDDFFLLWISDNKTPDDVTDDVIIQMWREA